MLFTHEVEIKLLKQTETGTVEQSIPAQGIFNACVDPVKANALVTSGALFKEQFFLGNALTHGLYSHYFQWLLMALAIESGRIKLPDNLSLKEIMQAKR